jgi:hypothetical protein
MASTTLISSISRLALDSIWGKLIVFDFYCQQIVSQRQNKPVSPEIWELVYSSFENDWVKKEDREVWGVVKVNSDNDFRIVLSKINQIQFMKRLELRFVEGDLEHRLNKFLMLPEINWFLIDFLIVQDKVTRWYFDFQMFCKVNQLVHMVILWNFETFLNIIYCLFQI